MLHTGMQAVRRWLSPAEPPTTFDGYRELPEEVKHEIVAALAGADRLALACCSKESYATVLAASAFDQRGPRRGATLAPGVPPSSVAWRDAYAAQRRAWRERLQCGESTVGSCMDLRCLPEVSSAVVHGQDQDGAWALFCDPHALYVATSAAPSGAACLLRTTASITYLSGTRQRWAGALGGGGAVAGGAHDIVNVPMRAEFESLALADDGALAGLEWGGAAVQIWHPQRGTVRHCVGAEDRWLSVQPVTVGGLALRRCGGVDLLGADGVVRALADIGAEEDVCVTAFTHGEVVVLRRPSRTLPDFPWQRRPVAHLQVYGRDATLRCCRTMPGHTLSALALADDSLAVTDLGGVAVLRRVAGRLWPSFRVDVAPSIADLPTLRLAREFAPGMVALTDVREDSCTFDETRILYVDLQTRSVLASNLCYFYFPAEVQAVWPDGTLWLYDRSSRYTYRLY